MNTETNEPLTGGAGDGYKRDKDGKQTVEGGTTRADMGRLDCPGDESVTASLPQDDATVTKATEIGSHSSQAPTNCPARSKSVGKRETESCECRVAQLASTSIGDDEGQTATASRRELGSRLQSRRKQKTGHTVLDKVQRQKSKCEIKVCAFREMLTAQPTTRRHEPRPAGLSPTPPDSGRRGLGP